MRKIHFGFKDPSQNIFQLMLYLLVQWEANADKWQA
jgi:hypothetical protein